MGANGVTPLFAVGALLLAAWLDLRLSKRRPESPTRRVAHAFAAFVLVQLGASVFASAVQGGARLPEQLIVLFLLYLPGLIYAFLGGIWLTRTLVEIAQLTRR